MKMLTKIISSTGRITKRNLLTYKGGLKVYIDVKTSKLSTYACLISKTGPAEDNLNKLFSRLDSVIPERPCGKRLIENNIQNIASDLGYKVLSFTVKDLSTGLML